MGISKRRTQVGDWCWSSDGERYWNSFETKEEAKGAALREYDPNESSTLYLAQVGEIPDVAWAISESMDIDCIQENAEEIISDNYANEDDVIKASSKAWSDLQRWLIPAIEEWALRYDVHVNWYQIDSTTVEKINLIETGSGWHADDGQSGSSP